MGKFDSVFKFVKQQLHRPEPSFKIGRREEDIMTDETSREYAAYPNSQYAKSNLKALNLKRYTEYK
jgi:hypothetical protein